MITTMSGPLDRIESSPTLIVIPGFLTEPHRLAQEHKPSVLDSIDPSALLDRRAWLKSMNAICDDRVNIECFKWGSQSVVHMLTDLVSSLITRSQLLNLGSREFTIKLTQIAQELHSSWREAREEADHSVNSLCERILAAPDPSSLVLIGHSLGARLALKALNQLYQAGETCLPKLSAWAPALSLSEMPCHSIAQLNAPPEIIYSRSDLVLKYIFPLGQGPKPQANLLGGLSLIKMLWNYDETKRAIGLVGPPKDLLLLGELSQDLSDRSMTHLGYLPAAESLFEESPYLSQLMPQSN